MNLLIKNGTVIDPANNIDEHLDILVEDSKIKEIAPNIVRKDAKLINASHCIVTPGLIDVHVHFREPGEPHKETIYSGSRAAAAGGFTTVICQPNTNPKINSPENVRLIMDIAKKDSVVNLYPSACITKNHRELVNIKEVKTAGAIKLTDDGDPVIEDELMERALREAKKWGIGVSPHCELSPWAEKNLGTTNYELEPVLIKRDIKLAEKTNSPLHISHVSMEESINEIAHAKQKGLPITCEVTPHHLILTKEARELYGSNAKVNPPLRTSSDVNALREALRDGTIDAIASDHAPHLSKGRCGSPDPHKSFIDWEEASFGLIGLETTLGLILTKLVAPGIISLKDAIAKMTINPARIFNLPAGRLTIGIPADITIIDLEKEWTVDVNQFKSKSRNCPFHNWKLEGKAITTIVSGKIIFQEQEVIS